MIYLEVFAFCFALVAVVFGIPVFIVGAFGDTAGVLALVVLVCAFLAWAVGGVL